MKLFLVIFSMAIALITSEFLVRGYEYFFTDKHLIVSKTEIIRSALNIPYEREAVLGFLFPLGSKITDRILNEHRITTEAFYAIDPWGLRLDDTYGEQFFADKYTAFFGCSFTFGQLVNSDKSLPAQFQRLRSRTHVYNYSVIGGGPHETLYRLRNFETPLKEKSGTAIFVWIDPHLERIAGSASYFSWHPSHRTPLYEMDGNTLVLRGFFDDMLKKRPILALNLFMGRLSRRSRLMAKIIPRLPERLWYSSELWTLAAEQLSAIKTVAENRLGAARFIVIVWPNSTLGSKTLIPLLNKKGIESLDYSNLWDYPVPEHLKIPFDGHPSAEAYKIVAEHLSLDLRNQSRKNASTL